MVSCEWDARIDRKKIMEKLAKEIIKVVGKNAIRGGIVGLVTSLVWFSTVCALEDDE